MGCVWLLEVEVELSCVVDGVCDVLVVCGSDEVILDVEGISTELEVCVVLTVVEEVTASELVVSGSGEVILDVEEISTELEVCAVFRLVEGVTASELVEGDGCGVFSEDVSGTLVAADESKVEPSELLLGSSEVASALELVEEDEIWLVVVSGASPAVVVVFCGPGDTVAEALVTCCSVVEGLLYAEVVEVG